MQTLTSLHSLHNIYNVMLEMMSARGFIVRTLHCTMEYFTETFCFPDPDQPSILHVDRESLTLSLIHTVDREKTVRIFFLEPNGGLKIGKKALEDLLKRLGETRTRGIFIVPDGNELTSHAKKLIDNANRSDKNVLIEYFLESQVQVNITVWGKQFREYRLLSEAEKRELLQKFDMRKIAIIGYDDPLARYFGMQHNDVICLTRGSESAGLTNKFMRCLYAEQYK